MIKTITLSCLLSVFSLTAAEEKSIVAIYDLEGAINESGQKDFSVLDLDVRKENPPTLLDITMSLGKAAEDPLVKGVVLDVDDASLGFAQTQELRRRLEAVRSAGKDVWLYTDSFNNGTALLGSVANQFTLMPHGDVSFSGVYTESFYYKDFLDRIGVDANVVHIGDFKSYGEQYYRNGPSKFATERTEALIGNVFEQLVSNIAIGRNLPAEKVRGLIDRGILTPQDVKDAGLVDALKHRTDFAAAVKEAYEDAEFDHNYGIAQSEDLKIDGLLDLVKLFKGKQETASETDYVAVVAFEGGISRKTVAPVRRQILKLLKDEHAKGLVLRVNSPGGSAIASEVLWEATDEWKASGRPFVVSMGGVAASGGYYISSSADRIFAEGTTITGSIGVVAMKMVFGDAMEKWGISSHSTQRGEHANMLSISQSFAPEEAELLRDSMLQTYGIFKERIENGRGDRLQGELEDMAGGRVFTGLQALELGLVDEIGGLREAVTHVAKIAGVDSEAVKLVPEPKSLLDVILSDSPEPEDGEIIRMGASSSSLAESVRSSFKKEQLDAFPQATRKALTEVLSTIEICEDGQVQMVGPRVTIPLK